MLVLLVPNYIYSSRVPASLLAAIVREPWFADQPEANLSPGFPANRRHLLPNASLNKNNPRFRADFTFFEPRSSTELTHEKRPFMQIALKYFSGLFVTQFDKMILTKNKQNNEKMKKAYCHRHAAM